MQVSAISADRDAGTAYAMTKLAADDKLRATSLEWVVLRPSLVHARGAYGGTSAFRSLAAYPFAIPVPGSGTQRFQPIWIDDLSRVVALALESDALVRKTVDPVGPDTVTLREMLEDYRRWLGFARAPVIQVPHVDGANRGARSATSSADRSTRRRSRSSSTAIPGTPRRSSEPPGSPPWAGRRRSRLIPPTRRTDGTRESTCCDRCCAPRSRSCWLASAVVGVFAIGGWASTLAMALDISAFSAGIVLVLACIADLVVALLLMPRWQPRRLALIQVSLVAAYTAVATLLWPSLWAEALGPLVKNIPIAVAALILGAIEEER